MNTIINNESFDIYHFVDLYEKYQDEKNKGSNYDDIHLLIEEYEKLKHQLLDLKYIKQSEAHLKSVRKWSEKNVEKVKEAKRKYAKKMREKKKLEKEQKENSNEEN
jgi:hypothetical protein